jgi:hypothetical protein
MDQLSFKRDFAYKYVKPESFIKSHQTTKIILPLWRANRLSVIRGFIFLNMCFTVRLGRTQAISLKYKGHAAVPRKKKQRGTFFFVIIFEREKLFIFFTLFFPPFFVYYKTDGYLLKMQFHNYTLEVSVTTKDDLFVHTLYTFFINTIDYTNALHKGIYSRR